jgi:formimidoylglutamate deiminase
MDYVQRLRHQKRNRLCLQSDQDSGTIALQQAILHGRAANGHNTPPFSIGQPLDAVVYDAHHPLLAAAPIERRLSTIVYATDACARLGTLVNAQWIVQHQEHRHQNAIRSAFAAALRTLKSP